MSNFLGDIEILQPYCNVSTVMDGRGGIFSWVPDEPIKEWTMFYFHANKVRGNHYHPEFTEYFLVVEGALLLITIDPKTKKEINMLISKGMCFRTPPNTPHAICALEETKCMSFLTKPWDECENPIIFEDIVPFDKEYNEYKSKHKI